MGIQCDCLGDGGGGGGVHDKCCTWVKGINHFISIKKQHVYNVVDWTTVTHCDCLGDGVFMISTALGLGQ